MTAPAAQLRHGDIVRIRGERWRIVRHIGYGATAIVDATGCDATNRAEQARFLLPFEPFDRLDAASTPRLVGPTHWRCVARRTLAEACPSWTSLRAATQANLTLIPFQLEPALALARGDGCRFLIADAVGLGKTVQAGLMIAETLQRRQDGKAIVISPAGLREQWREEFRNRFGLDADILDAAGVARAASQLPADINPWAVPPLVITSIDFIKRPEIMRSVESLTWDVAVFDEAHNLAGRSDRAAAAGMLGDRARVLVLLTATPHSGDDAAFSRLCGLGKLSGAEPLVTFRRTRADAGLTGSCRALLLRVRPTPAEASMHEALLAYARLLWNQSPGGASARLAASVLTRRACSSAESLARSIGRRLALLPDSRGTRAEQPDLPFDAHTESDEEPHGLLGLPGLPDASDERLRLEHLLGLVRAAAAAESKVAALRRLISRTKEPAIVFTEYRDTLQRLALALGDVDAAQLHGGLTLRERADAVRRFTDGTARLLLATDAGSEGLNLHHRCRLVINLELPWTPLRLEQRAGRVDRIGQTRRVHIVHLVAAGTCEESTLARLVQRIRRLHGTMSLITQLPDEQRVAESVLGRQPIPDLIGSPPVLPPGVVTVDLRHDAHEEALRIAQARAFCATGREQSTGGRPVMTSLRRRRRNTAPPQCLWVFKAVFTSAGGRLVWEPLMSFRAELSGNRACLFPPRALLNPERPAIQDLLRRTRDELLRDLQHSLQRPLQRWSGRERDIMAGLRDRHARLSAGLLQGALFDRRDERLAASQASLLDRALSRSAIRLADLEHCEDLRVDASDLVFAVILD